MRLSTRTDTPKSLADSRHERGTNGGQVTRFILDLDAKDDPIQGTSTGASSTANTTAAATRLSILCGDHLLAAKLRRSYNDAGAGSTEEIARIVERIRARWPRVKILLRADSGFAREALMAWCEANRVDFLFGLARSARLVDHIHIDLAWANDEADRTGRPARRFADFRWRTLDSWSCRRRVLAKAEWMPRWGEAGASPRFVVTSLPVTQVGARALYERLYCARGDME